MKLVIRSSGHPIVGKRVPVTRRHITDRDRQWAERTAREYPSITNGYYDLVLTRADDGRATTKDVDSDICIK